MPKDKDFKRLVRDRMAQTGERYTQARAGLAGAGGDWKDQHIARADSTPVAVWRVFAAPDGERLDIRQRWFTEPADEGDARSREERLRREVITQLDTWRREEFMEAPNRPSAVTGLEIHFHEGFRGRRSAWMGAGPPEASRLPAAVLAARALAELTGDPHEPVGLAARFRAVAAPDGTVSTTLEVVGESLPVADIRRSLADQLTAHPTPPNDARAIEAGVFADGKASVIWRASPPGVAYGLPSDADPTLPSAALLAAALAELRG